MRTFHYMHRRRRLLAGFLVASLGTTIAVVAVVILAALLRVFGLTGWAEGVVIAWPLAAAWISVGITQALVRP